MKILDRYIFKEVLTTVFFSIVLFVFILVAGNALRDVVALLASGKISLMSLLEIVYFLILYVVTYALPIGVLMGVLIVLGRLSAGQELTAMKSIGLSIYRISMPIFLIGMLGTVLSLAVNFYYAPQAKANYRHLIANVFKNNPLQYLEPNTFIHDFPGYILYIEKQEGKAIQGFWLWGVDAQKRVRLFFKAKEAHFDYDKKTETLKLTLLQGAAEERLQEDPERLHDPSQPHLVFKEWSIQLSLNDFLNRNKFYKKLSMYTLGELIQEKKKITGDSLASMKIEMQIQKNFAIAFSVFVFAVLAIPLGIKASRKETYANAAIAIALGLFYHVIFASLAWAERYPLIRPDLLIWTPNLVYLGLALFLLKKVNQH